MTVTMMTVTKEKLLMLKKATLAAALTVMMMSMGAFASAWAQDSTPAKASSDADKVQDSYRLDFLISELEDGKKINTRQYSMNSRPLEENEIKIGSRVPVEAKQGEFQYLDIGTSIACKLWDQTNLASLGSNVSLKVEAELSNFAAPDQQTAQQFHPVVRQLRIKASTIATLDKPMIIGIVDDPNSKRQFQLEVTVTKLR
jgi:hypothetical protein